MKIEKIMKIIITNFEMFGYEQIIRDSKDYDYDSIDPDSFFSSIKYDLEKEELE